jgi:hypothetical protein
MSLSHAFSGIQISAVAAALVLKHANARVLVALFAHLRYRMTTNYSQHTAPPALS